MEQAFSQIVSILTAAVMFFLVPLAINFQRQENMVQLAVMESTVELVDSVRNVGMLTEDTFERYQNKIRQLQGGLEIYMVHTAGSITEVNGTMEETTVLKTEQDIMEALEIQGKYQFQIGDYFRIEVKKTSGKGSSLLYGMTGGTDFPKKETYVYYGGSIRYED